MKVRITDIDPRAVKLAASDMRRGGGWWSLGTVKATFIPSSPVHTEYYVDCELMTLEKCDGDHPELVPCNDPECWHK